MKKERFGTMPDGVEVYAYTFGNEFITATVLNLGGILQKLIVGGKDIVCGYGSVDDILRGSGYHGALIGRYANRIRSGVFTLNGKTYQLAKNERGVTHLHGGDVGFNRRIFSAASVTKKDAERLVLSYFSPDGEEGYPGNLDVIVTYEVKGSDLSIHYAATTDADTVLNMTNHAYFNLNGYDSGSVLGHTLGIFADEISAVDHDLIPVSRLPVAGTPFDFNTPKPVGRDIDAPHEQLAIAGGYDHNFYLSPKESTACCGKTLGKCAVLTGDSLSMEVFTDCPCVQLYTAGKMDCPVPFKGGVAQKPFSALCLETQYAPDSPNHGEALLRAGDTYDKTTLFRFRQAE